MRRLKNSTVTWEAKHPYCNYCSKHLHIYIFNYVCMFSRNLYTHISHTCEDMQISVDVCASRCWLGSYWWRQDQILICINTSIDTVPSSYSNDNSPKDFSQISVGAFLLCYTLMSERGRIQLNHPLWEFSACCLRIHFSPDIAIQSTNRLAIWIRISGRDITSSWYH